MIFYILSVVNRWLKDDQLGFYFYTCIKHFENKMEMKLVIKSLHCLREKLSEAIDIAESDCESFISKSINQTIEACKENLQELVKKLDDNSRLISSGETAGQEDLQVISEDSKVSPDTNSDEDLNEFDIENVVSQDIVSSSDSHGTTSKVSPTNPAVGKVRFVIPIYL